MESPVFTNTKDPYRESVGISHAARFSIATAFTARYRSRQPRKSVLMSFPSVIICKPP